MSKRNRQSKEMERSMETVDDAAKATEEQRLNFDSWHALRKSRIPAIHKKEVLKADFKARKVPMDSATIAEFDEALKKYGVQLA